MSSAGQWRVARTAYLARREVPERLRRILKRAVRLGLTLVILVLVFGWWMPGVQLAAKEPPFMRLDSLRFRLALGESVTLGRRELGQPEGPGSAEDDQLLVTYESDGSLSLKRVAHWRRLDLGFAEGEMTVLSDRFPIATKPGAKTRVIVGAGVFELSADATGLIALDIDPGGTHAARYQISPLAACRTLGVG